MVKAKISWKDLFATYQGAKKAYEQYKSYRDRSSKISPAEFASRVAKRMKSDKRKQITPGQTVVQRKRTGAVSSKSMGKIKTRKYRATKRQKNAIKGVEQTVEEYKEFVTTSQTAWVGHSVCIPEVVRYNIWRLILKKLMSKTGNCIRNFADPPTSYNVGNGDVIAVYFQNQDATAGSINWTYGGTGDWDTAVAYFVSNAFLHAEGVILKHIIYMPDTAAAGLTAAPPYTRLDLENAYVKMYFKSSMKLQNRTVNGTDISMDDVDNVPLYGRSYGGVGNGAIWFGQSDSPVVKQLIADKDKGYIEGDASGDFLQEPLHQLYFKHVTQKGKVHLDPGYIKTSVLTYSKNMSLNHILRRVNQICTAAKIRDSFGNFRFFGLERMIDTAAESSITLGIEINNYMNFNLYTRYRDTSIPLFARVAL